MNLLSYSVPPLVEEGKVQEGEMGEVSLNVEEGDRVTWESPVQVGGVTAIVHC